MAADARERLAAACDAWGLAGTRPLEGGVVALVMADAGHVVKVQPRFHPEEAEMRGEAAALAAWAGSPAAVELLDSRDDGMTLLMPRVHPGTTLDDEVGDYDEQLRIVGALVRELHTAADIRHGDLHGANVLRSGERWVAIDPKGLNGKPELDVWLLLCPQAPPFDNVDEVRRRIGIYAAAAGLDPEAAAESVRAIAEREAVLCAESAFGGWPERLRRLAAALS